MSAYDRPSNYERRDPYARRDNFDRRDDFDRRGGRGGGGRGFSGRGGGGRRGNADTQSLHVRGYDVDKTTDSVIRELFERFGSVADVYMPRHYQSKEVRGFTYVQFHNEDDAEKARLELDRTDAFKDGTTLNVMWAQGRRKTPIDMQRMDRIRAQGGLPDPRGPEYRGSRLPPPRGRGGFARGGYSMRGRGGPNRYERAPLRGPNRDHSPEYDRYSRKRSRSVSRSPRGRSYSPPPREYRRRRYDSPLDDGRSPSPIRGRRPPSGTPSPPPRGSRYYSPRKGGSLSPPPKDYYYSPEPRRGRYSPPPQNGRYASPPRRERSLSPPPPKRASLSPPRDYDRSPPRGANGYGKQRLSPTRDYP